MTCWRLVVVSAVLAVCCAPEVPSQVESGFKMSEHSLAFANFAQGFDDSQMDTELMQRMFGDQVCIAGMSPCQLTPGARAFMKKANTSMGGGRCEGFAVMSSLFHAGKLKAVDFGGQTVRDLTLEDNTPLQREIAYWFSTQLVPEVAGKKTKSYMPKDVMPVLAEALKKDGTERYRIGIVRKKGSTISGGHALTPISYSADPGAKGVYWLRVYDNNNPDQERLLKLDTTNNRWEFEATDNPGKPPRLYFGDESNQNPLYFAPVFSREGQLPCSFCNDNGESLVTTTGGIEVSTPSVGIRDGKFLGLAFPKFTAPLDDQPAEFIIPLEPGDVNLSISNPGDAEFPGTPQAVDVQGPNFSVSAADLLVTGSDQLNVSSNGSSVAYVNESRTSLSLKTEVTLANGRALAVAAVLSGASSGVSTNIDPSNGKVSVAAGGSEGTQVTMVVTATNPMGQETSAQLTFTSQGDGGVSADTAMWMMGMAPLTGTVTNNGMTTTVTNACLDGVRSGMETDVDCGSVCTTKCAIAQRCAVGADCDSTFCHATTLTCVATSCEDGRVSGGEADVDCGGPCAPCALGRACTQNADCAGTSACVNNACAATFAVGVAVTGLPPSSAGLVLRNNGADDLRVGGNGSFAFTRRVTGAYAVTVFTQPDVATCAVMSGSGTANGDVSVQVNCTPTFSVGGSVTGLPASESVTLRNGTESLLVSASGAFVFSTRVTGAYAVTVETQPATATCTVTSGSGTATADVTDVTITCTTGFSIGGSVSGLPAAQSVTLRNNGGTDLVVNANGPFTFPARVMGAYAVTVQTQPMNATCVVGNGSGTASGDVTDVTVTCTSAFTIGGIVFGLPIGESVTLRNNNADDRVVMADGPFTFATPTSTYNVTVFTQPSGVRCAVANPSGTAIADVTNIAVTCAPSGATDPTFNSVGWLSVPRSAQSDFWIDGVMNSDDSMTLVGQVQSGGNTSWVVSKVRADGTLDPTYGTGGHLSITAGAGIEYPRGIFTDTMGRSVVVGTLIGTDPDLGIARITPNGMMDPTFGTFGLSTHDTGQWEYFEDVAQDSSGRYVAIGRRSVTGGGPHEAVLGRLNDDGSLDTTFGTGGWVFFDAGGDESGNSVVIDPATQDIIALVSLNNDTVVIRYDSSGTRVMTFGTMGVATIDLSGAGRGELAYRLRMDGSNILIAGRADSATDSELVVARLTSTGALDTTFGTGGRLLINRGTNDVLYAITSAPGGGWYIGGHSDTRMLVSKITSTGAVDTTFGANGFFENVLANSALAYHLMLDSTQRIIAVGTIRLTGTEDLGVTRLTP